MADSDLLKEAIADAKAVRETALANAKMAIEEAFTPRIQSMISRKLKEDLEDGEDEEDAKVEENDDEDEDDKEKVEENDDEDEDDDEIKENAESDDEDEEDGTGQEVTESDDEDEDDKVEESEDNDTDDEDELDLESIIRELESELNEQDGEEEEEEEEDKVEESDDKDEDDEDLDENIEIDVAALLRELEDMDNEDEDEEEKVEELKQTIAQKDAQLAEFRQAFVTLKSKLQETNLLNSKLFYTNKIFRAHELDDAQKVKVIENLDRAKDVREVKLVYATLVESFAFGSSVKRRVSIHEALDKGASKVTKSVKPAKEDILEEGSTLRTRFQHLAGIKILKD